MRGLESIVPPLKLCKQIPAGQFEESVVVWVRSHPPKVGRTWLPTDRETYAQFLAPLNDTEVLPAPTLQEIMEALPKSIEDDRHHREVILIRNSLGRHGDWQIGYATIFHRGLEASRFVAANPDRPECAALELWLQLHEAGMIPQKGEGE